VDATNLSEAAFPNDLEELERVNGEGDVLRETITTGDCQHIGVSLSSRREKCERTHLSRLERDLNVELSCSSRHGVPLLAMGPLILSVPNDKSACHQVSEGPGARPTSRSGVNLTPPRKRSWFPIPVLPSSDDGGADLR
jgi:hypothetical protein